MTEIEFCEHYCGELSGPQRMMLKHNIARGTFLGVGRAIGRTAFMPVISIGNQANVIDRAGYYQLADIDGRIGYSKEVTST